LTTELGQVVHGRPPWQRLLLKNTSPLSTKSLPCRGKSNMTRPKIETLIKRCRRCKGKQPRPSQKGARVKIASIRVTAKCGQVHRSRQITWKATRNISDLLRARRTQASSTCRGARQHLHAARNQKCGPPGQVQRLGSAPTQFATRTSTIATTGVLPQESGCDSEDRPRQPDGLSFPRQGAAPTRSRLRAVSSIGLPSLAPM